MRELSVAERLERVLDEVLGVLESDREPYCARGDTRGGQVGITHVAVAGGGHVRGEGVRTTEGSSKGGGTEPVGGGESEIGRASCRQRGTVQEAAPAVRW